MRGHIPDVNNNNNISASKFSSYVYAPNFCIYSLTCQCTKHNSHDKRDSQRSKLVYTLHRGCPALACLNHRKHVLDVHDLSAVGDGSTQRESLIKAETYQGRYAESAETTAHVIFRNDHVETKKEKFLFMISYTTKYRLQIELSS